MRLSEDQNRWPRVRARYLFREVNERNFDLPLASVTKDGGVEFRSDLDISVWNPGDDTSHYKRVCPGDFVIGLRSFQSGIGFSPLEGLVSPAYTVLRPVHPGVVTSYFRHLLKSGWVISLLENVAQGIRQGRTIGTEDFYEISLPLPPLPEQRAIADLLDIETARTDALINKKRRMIDLLEERWRAELAVLFGADDGVRFKRLLRRPLAYGVLVPQQAGASGVPMLRIKDFFAGDVDLEGVARIPVSQSLEYRRTVVEVGDLVVSVVGTLGRSALIDDRMAGSNLNRALARVQLTPEVPRDLVRLWFSSDQFADQARLATSSDSAQPTLNLGDLKNFAVGIPSDRAVWPGLSERLLRAETGLRTAQSRLRRQLELLAEHRQALITAAVTGELTVPGVAA